MNGISVLGIFVADISFSGEKIPSIGETILGDSYNIGPGGKGCNQAIAIARLGGKVNFISKIGKDDYGQLAINTLDQNNIDTSTIIQSADHQTGVAGIMIDKKTGALLSISSTLGPIYSGIDSSYIEHYNNFGRALGKGFQIHDDLLEITSSPERMGKSLGSDLEEGKQTMMVIKARTNYPKEWDNLIKSSNNSDLIKNCKTFFEDKNIFDKTELMAKSYFNSARKSLAKIDNINTSELLEFVNIIEKRAF